jgi:superfamily I DNA and/or RNA helicase
MYLLADLWSSLFLVIPCLSTTFASVGSMLKDLLVESLGWLLIDETGQATPQAAVGAIMRTKRALLVGDPMQIEPVVTLPDTLTQTICLHFGVNPEQFNAPQASAQTLADTACRYFTTFSNNGYREIGIPLLVHRRCDEPMFSIANTIAYEGLMVHAKMKKLSAVRECLGPWHGSMLQARQMKNGLLKKDKWYLDCCIVLKRLILVRICTL